MPRVFLSYARADAAAVDALEHELRSLGLDVWRDQESLYSGQRWPKALGEAIVASDAVVLVWSNHSAQSDFVELEWTTALAIKKLLIPWLLDRTPLAPALRSIHGVVTSKVRDAARAVRAALDAHAPTPDVAATQAVLTDLGNIATSDPHGALQAAKMVFQQHEVTIQGTVYQAGGDIHISVPPPQVQPKPWPERWQVWVALVVGILTAVTLARSLVNNTADQPAPGTEQQRSVATEQMLAGFVRGEKNEPLDEVTVALPAFQQSAKSDQNGYFRFVVQVPEQQSVVLLARKEGYEIFETYATLGSQNMTFTLRRAR